MWTECMQAIALFSRHTTSADTLLESSQHKFNTLNFPFQGVFFHLLGYYK